MVTVTVPFDVLPILQCIIGPRITSSVSDRVLRLVLSDGMRSA